MHSLAEHLKRFSIPLIAVALAIVVYLNALQNGYAVDDVPIIRLNPVVQDLGNIREILLGSYWPGSNELYRPLVLLSFAVEWALFGDRPAAFHLVNVLLHAVATLLVFVLMRRLGATALAAGLGAAIFAVHPVHVEAVANIVGRAEVLATIFVLVACLVHLREETSRWGRALAVSLCYLLALGAKEIAVSLPAILVLLGLYRSGDVSARSVVQTVRNRIEVYAGTAIALGGFLLLRRNAIGELGGNAPASYLEPLSTADRLATAVRLWPEFARLLFWPKNLAWDWGPGVITPVGWGDGTVYLGLFMGLAAVALAVAAWRSHRWLSLAVGWFVITFFVISQIPFAIGVMLAERHLYLPSVAVSLLVPAVLPMLQHREVAVRMAVSVALIGALVLGSWRTWQRNPIWYSTHTAYVSLGYEQPRSYRAYWYASKLLQDEGRLSDAVPLLRRAAELAAGRYYILNLEFSEALLAARLHAEADEVLARSIEVAPNAARAYLFLGRSLIEQDRFSEAAEILLRGRGLAADSVKYEVAFAHHLAIAHDGAGQPDTALAWRIAGMSVESGQPLYQEWLHLARLRTVLGERELASAALDSARHIAPDSLSMKLVLQDVEMLSPASFGGWTASPILGEAR